jgi:hypothetical protein
MENDPKIRNCCCVLLLQPSIRLERSPIASALRVNFFLLLALPLLPLVLVLVLLGLLGLPLLWLLSRVRE